MIVIHGFWIDFCKLRGAVSVREFSTTMRFSESVSPISLSTAETSLSTAKNFSKACSDFQ